MSDDPKEQNAELKELIRANKLRLQELQKTIKDLESRTAARVAEVPRQREKN